MKRFTIVAVLLLALTISAAGFDTAQDSLKSKKDKIDLYLGIRGVLPIPSTYPATALSTINTSTSTYKVSSFGWGMFLEAKQKEYTVFFDMMAYSYDQELLKPGEGRNVTVWANDPGNTYSTFPQGVKYSAGTASIRLGGKYTYIKGETFQPWIGLAFGINIWSVKYVPWTGSGSYTGADAKGSTWRHALLAGLDVKYQKATFTFFFEAVSPVAIYSIDNLFGVGDWPKDEGWATMTYPTPRIGISASYLVGKLNGF